MPAALTEVVILICNRSVTGLYVRKEFSTSGVAVNVIARTWVGATLRLGMPRAIEVTEAAAALRQKPGARTGINTQQVVELPRNDGIFLILRCSRRCMALSFSYCCSPSEASEILEPGAATFFRFNREVPSITGNCSAEYEGVRGAAIVNAAMRSGPNTLHSTASGFLRITDLNVIGYVFGQWPAPLQKPTLQRNQLLEARLALRTS